MRISRSTELKDGAHIRICTKPKGGGVSDVFSKDIVGITVDIPQVNPSHITVKTEYTYNDRITSYQKLVVILM